ncbi:hypothetical protein DOTSEDRAFT_74156 [Dothistroma septosporum NZE10]|uniref:Uncharacterized protein n=1 Tax=Dothistroma septosporum (strain NZE10 / CBS 128990) TaxID=675120 RepID=N1PGN3_DOTSN|nr:hypothetical protein DOTSEDRAFT_74156 [Dothistroma septosporum NZE10]
MKLAALAVEITCDIFDSDAFETIVTYDADDDAPGLVFAHICGTDECKEKVQDTTTGYSLATQRTNKTLLTVRAANWGQFAGNPYGNSDSRFYGFAANMFSSPEVQVLIADFASISGPVANFLYVPGNGSSIEVHSPNMFNVSLPTIRAVSCTPALQNVEVQATLERKVQAGLDGKVTLLSWAVTDFDTSSIRVTSELNITDIQVLRKLLPRGSTWGHSPSLNPDYSPVKSNFTNKSQLDDDDIRPSAGIASNFFELLAAYESSQGRNSSALLDVRELGAATSAVYGLHNAELLSHFRATSSLSTRATFDERQAQMDTQEARVRPNARTTFAVVGMLCVIWVLLSIIFMTTTSSNVLLSKPGMISTQLSLFAGSEIVERLRGNNPDAVWDEKLSLGWWRPGEREVGDATLRWGIDIGRLDDSLQTTAIPRKTDARRCSLASLTFWRRRPVRGVRQSMETY